MIREVSKPGTGNVVVHEVPEACNSELLQGLFGQFKAFFRRLISKNQRKTINNGAFFPH